MCPVGAVSKTTNRSVPSATASAKARKTAISSVQGDRKSSASKACPWISRPSPAVFMTSEEYLAVSTAGSIRLTDRLGRASLAIVAARCAAGSVVERWTRKPRSASPAATAAATVVFPTPPLPMAKMTPCPGAASPSISSASVEVIAKSAFGISILLATVAGRVPRARRAGKPSTPFIVSGIRLRGRSRNESGIAASAISPRCCMATARRSERSVA